MIDRLLLFLTRKLKRKHIGWDGELYMTRFYLGRLGKWNFYLHRFLRGDNDRRLHDHPWANSYSIILSGSYVEERLLGVDPYTGPKTKFVTRKWFNAIRGVDFHRVLRLHKPVVWTLFFHDKRIKEWGFLEQGGVGYDDPQYIGDEYYGGSMAVRWFHDPFVDDAVRHRVEVPEELQ